VVALFATSIKNNADVRHILFTNAKEIPDIGRFETARFFEENEIEVIRLPYTCKIPRNDYDCWGSTFFIFDILKHISENALAGDIYTILDPDCVFVNSISKIIDFVDRYDILLYETGYAYNWDINGLTRLDMKQIYEEINGTTLAEPPRAYGGEWFGAKVKVIKDIVRIFNETRPVIDQRVQDGKKSFNTEEHFLNYIYQKLGLPSEHANQHIRRVWTGADYTNISGDEFSLDIWHTPAEKTSGIAALFEQIANPQSGFHRINSREQFATYLGSHLGISEHVGGEKKGS